MSESRNVREAQAKLAADIARTWRSWRELITELEDALPRTDSDDDGLFGEDSRPIRRAKLQAAARRQMEAVIERRRQQAQADAEAEARRSAQAMPDPDTVRAALIQQIRRELLGEVHRQGLALVWWENRLIEFDHRRLLTETSDDAYLAAGLTGKGPSRPVAIAAAVGMLLLFVTVLRVLWGVFFASPVATTGTERVAQVGDQTVAMWDVAQIQIGGQQLEATVRTRLYPLDVCVRPGREAIAASPGATLVLTGTTSVRRYTVATGGGDYDLVVTSCDGAALQIKATLADARTSDALPTGVIQAVRVEGADVDPQNIPPDRMRVIIDVATTDSGTLILADGSRWSPSEQQPSQGGMRLIYLVPARDSGQDAGWEVVRAVAGVPQIAALSIPAPTSRLAMLRDRLLVREPQIGRVLRDGAPTAALTVTLSLTEGEPITLLRGDVLFHIDGASNPVPAQVDLPILEAGKPQTVTIPLPESRSALEVVIGIWRARIEKGK
jgi:hypothetical protein